MLSLTHRCNLDCVHCYLKGDRCNSELATTEWIEVLDQAADLGCLFAVFTGGEPLLRPDFARIYLHAKSLGMLVGVMTNGTLIDEATLDLFEEWPPHRVDVSIYAWKPETYRTITGHDVHTTVYHAVEAMRSRQIRVTTKTIVLRENRTEIEDIRAWAERCVPLHRIDGDIFPTASGGPEPKKHQLPLRAVFDLEQKARGEDHWKREVTLWKEQRNRSSRFCCGGGRTSFHVVPNGAVSLCLLDEALTVARCNKLSEAWHGPIRERRGQHLPEDHPCAACDERPYCDVCPPLLRMEAGSEDRVSPERCAMARLRLQRFEADTKEVV
jgi:MoaA/NifB/PqqE/SkfB family radical SAM enzyme